MSLEQFRRGVSNLVSKHAAKLFVGSSIAAGEYMKHKAGYRTASKAVPYASKSRMVHTKSKRRRTVKGRRHKKRNSGYSRVTPRSTRTAYKSGKDVKLPKAQRGKIHVSAQFKKMVKRALEEEQSEGVYTDYSAGLVPSSAGATVTNDNQQHVTPFLTQGDGTLGYGNQLLDFFTPNRMIDAASVLFNGKVRSNNYTTTVNNFQFDQLKLDVDYSSVVVILRNNTQVTKHISFYECVPKVHSASNAYADWVSFLAQEATDGMNLTVVPADVTSIGITPSCTKKFSTKWKSAVREIVLGPGQMTEFSVIGPKNTTYDYSKFYINTNAVEFPKGYTKSCFFVVKPVEPSVFVGASAVATVVGYDQSQANPVTNGLPFGVACIMRFKYKFMAPELTPVANRKTYVYSYGTSLGAIGSNPNGAVARIDEENPIQTEQFAGQHGTGAGPVTGV